MKEALTADAILAPMDDRFRNGVTELHREIVQTSPVNTGRYRADWTLEFLGPLSAEIRNTVEYAGYLIFGTERFRNFYGRVISAAAHAGGIAGSRYPKADIARGILHDVRAILFEWEARLKGILEGG